MEKTLKVNHQTFEEFFLVSLIFKLSIISLLCQCFPIPIKILEPVLIYQFFFNLNRLINFLIIPPKLIHIDTYHRHGMCKFFPEKTTKLCKSCIFT